MGFDNECILNIQSLAGEYFCPVCRLLVYPNEAMQSQCTHLYCKPCLTYVVSTTRACPYDGYLVTTADSKPLTETNKALAETIGKIVVHCLYHRSGCTWQGALTDCITHCSGCAFGSSPVVCNRCGIQIVHRQVQEHAQNCPGVQSMQQVGTAQDSSTNATASAVDPNQTATQSGPETSQVQASQTTAILAAPGQVSNQPINSSSQGQALTQSTTLTSEQWYQQQQQQFQQYYQQYPGYDPYQSQHQQYYPYQQSASIQPHPSNFSSQHQTQALVQPQPQSQTQPLPQVQVQPQSQLPPPPPLYMVHGQSQSTTGSQTSMTTVPQTHVQLNTQHQLYPSGNAHPQIPPQTHPSSLSHSHSLPPSYPQAQPHSQQSAQTSHYQQAHPHVQNQQGQIQQHAYTHLQPQHPQHSVSQPQSQHHTLPQTQIAPHNQPMNISMQPQMQNPPAQAVTGHHSYPQPQPHQQLHTGVAQPTIQTPAQTGSLPQPHPTQMQDHFPQQPSMIRPIQLHGTYLNQQHPPSLLSPGQVQNTSHVPQLPTHVHAQQPGHTGNQRPVMNSVHQQTPQQHMQLKQNFVQHSQYLPPQVPIASHLGSQGPPPHSAQHNQGYLHPNTTMSNKMQQNQSQNLVGRPMAVSHGVQSLSHSQSLTASHLRQSQTRENIPSTNQSHDYGNDNRVQLAEQLSLESARRTMIDAHTEHKDTADKEGKLTSQKAAQTVNDLDMKSVIRSDVAGLKTVKSEADANPIDQKYSLTGKVKSGNVAVGSELLDDESGKPLIKETEVKTDAKESPFDHSNVDKFGDGVTKDPKEISGVESKQMRHSDIENQKIDEFKNPSCRDANHVEQIGMPNMTSAGGSESFKITPNASASFVDGPHSEKRKLAHYDGFLEKNQVHVSGFVQPSHLVSAVDQGRHHPQPNNFGPSMPPMLSTPPAGQLYPQAPANPPMQYSLQAPGYLGHAAHTSEHYSQSAIPDPGSAASFGRRLGNYTSPHQGDTQSQDLDQGPPSHGASSMPLGGASGGHNLPGHVGARAPLHTSEGQLGLPHPHPSHPIGNEMFLNLRPDGGRLGSAEQGPPVLAATHVRMNVAPGFESSWTPGLKDEKFKLMGTERLKPSSLDRGEFQDDFKQLNRLSQLDTEPFQNYDTYPLRNLDRGFHGPNHVSDVQFDSSGGGGGVSRLIPPHNLDSGFHPPYERRDITGRTDLARGGHREFFGSGLGYPRHHVDGLGPRSTFQDYHRINSRGFNGRPGISSFDEIDGRELSRFGDPFSNSLPESRLPFSSRSEFDGSGNFSMGEHLRSRDFIARDRHFGQLRLGERSGFVAQPGHGLMGELDGLGRIDPFGSGSRQSHLRPGEPGFRSSFSLQGFPDDSRIYSGDKDAFGSWRKRRSLSMGWCRICKVDCETVEGLDLHSQTREHQKMAMDMVQNIKQNAKKQKLSASENPLSEDPERSTNGDLEGQGKTIK